MWPYLAMGGAVALPALAGAGRREFVRFSLITIVLLSIFVGLRHRVGMDWNNYLRMIDEAKAVQTFGDFSGVSEPLYALLLVIGGWTGADMYFVNLITALVVIYGLYSFARQAPEPWLALLAAMPLYVLVVAMSANRQALAAGILMILVANWHRYGQVMRIGLIILAAGAHASALIFLIFVGFDIKMRPIFKGVAIALFSLVMIYLLQQSGRADYYNTSYGTNRSGEFESSGALIHVSLNALPALTYFLFPRMRPLLFPDSLLRIMAFAALITLPLTFIFANAAGRMSLYWFPVSMWFWGALPHAFKEPSRPLVRFLVAALMISLMYGWLAYANTAFAHLPYRNALFIGRDELQIGVLP